MIWNRHRITLAAVRLLTVAGIAAQPHLPVAVADDATLSTPVMAGMSHETLDTRTPLPLLAMMAEHQKRNMRDHLAAVQEIVAAIAADDMGTVVQAARRIGYSDTMARMCQHMGAATPGFADMALAFHRKADTIAEAAQRGDRQGATRALALTLGTCVGCHAAYRQQVVDEATWQRLTADAERR